ncbi:MAG: BMP family protein [Motiliproteus sp.]
MKWSVVRSAKKVLLATGGVLALSVAGSAFAESQTFKVAAVFPGNITDKSFNQAGYEGVVRAKKELGIELAYSEKVAQPDQAEALSDYARRGYQVVIGHGGEFQEAAKRVARRYPDTMFVVTNGVKARENIATLGFDNKQLGYVMGYIGGKMSKSGKGGYIGAQKIKFATELGGGFEAGFMAARPDGKVYTAWTNNWDDISKGKEAALNLISHGVDMIFPTMDNAVIGSLQAARQNEGVYGFGIYYDAIQDWPNTVLQSAILDMRSAMVEVIRLAKADQLEGKSYTFDLSQPEIARIGTYSEVVPESVRLDVDSAIRQFD